MYIIIKMFEIHYKIINIINQFKKFRMGSVCFYTCVYIFDFEKLEYISSAGLRILLTAMQVMEEQGSMVVKNVCEEVREVFEITGFIDDLTIE